MAIQKIQALPLRYLDAHPTGDLVSRVIADVDVFSDGLLMGFTQLFSGVLTIVGTLGFMLYINVPITLVVVVITPLSIVTAAFIAHKSEKHFRRQSEVRGEQTALINEMIEGQKVVQAFQQEDNCLDRFDEINGRLQAASLKAVFYSSLTNPVTRFVNAMVYAGVALVGALFAVQGGITVGQLSSFLGYANQYTKPFNEISGVVTELQNALTCAGRLFQMLDELEEDPDGADAYALPAQEVTGAVELAHVDFRYDPSRPLIEDLNISVRPACGHRGSHRPRQDHADQPAHALLRCGRRFNLRQRAGHPEPEAPVSPGQLRHGASGHLVKDRHHPGEHRVRKTGRYR